MDGPAQLGSTWELNVFTALQERKIAFETQVPALGGWSPGGTIIDFVIYKAGALRPIALFVDGPRWHTEKKKPYDLQKRLNLEQIGYEVKVIVDESETIEQTRQWLRENI
jgi:hypothetical protein